jgi:transcriptional regulator
VYVPPHFEETRLEVIQSLVHDRPLGALVTLGSQGLNANHVPFLLDTEPAPHGTLRAHVSRANAAWRDFASEVEALVIFQGIESYISPSWYEVKQETGKVVPTWNYAVVHAYGRLRAIDDPEWLRGFVTRLTDRFEASRAAPWKVTDAPAEYIDKQLRGIVGLELAVTRWIGKWKVNQNRSAADRAGVVSGLRAIGDATARAMADVVEERLDGRDEEPKRS